MTEPGPFTTAEQYHAHLIAQADEQVQRLAGKVGKARRDLEAAEAAHVEAVRAAARLQAGDLPEFVAPTSIARVSPQ